jgi:uncharacterized protein YdhG (YjbR/CyaY superfamily)
VHFAAYEKHIGFYPGTRAISDFTEKIKGYKTSKGAIQFQLDKPIPLQLIKDIAEHLTKSVKN